MTCAWLMLPRSAGVALVGVHGESFLSIRPSPQAKAIMATILSPPEDGVSRVVRRESASRARAKMLRGIAVTLQAMAGARGVGPEEMDQLAFLALSLEAIARSVDETATAWEKRDYWVKADRFRAEWSWVEPLRRRMAEALRGRDWNAALQATRQVAERVATVRLPKPRRGSRIWEGAWRRWSSST